MDASPLKFDIAWLWQPQVSGTSDRCSRRNFGTGIITVVLHFSVSSRFHGRRNHVYKTTLTLRLPTSIRRACPLDVDKGTSCLHRELPGAKCGVLHAVSRDEHRELHATRLYLHLLALVYMWIHGPERGRGYSLRSLSRTTTLCL